MAELSKELRTINILGLSVKFCNSMQHLEQTSPFTETIIQNSERRSILPVCLKQIIPICVRVGK